MTVEMWKEFTDWIWDMKKEWYLSEEYKKLSDELHEISSDHEVKHRFLFWKWVTKEPNYCGFSLLLATLNWEIKESLIKDKFFLEKYGIYSLPKETVEECLNYHMNKKGKK